MRSATPGLATGLRCLAFAAVAGADDPCASRGVDPGRRRRCSRRRLRAGTSRQLQGGGPSLPEPPWRHIRRRDLRGWHLPHRLVARRPAVVLRSRDGQEPGIAVGPSRDGECLTKPAPRARLADRRPDGPRRRGRRRRAVLGQELARHAVRAMANREYGIYQVHVRSGRLDHSFASAGQRRWCLHPPIASGPRRPQHRCRVRRSITPGVSRPAVTPAFPVPSRARATSPPGSPHSPAPGGRSVVRPPRRRHAR
jgi:hypothetical protein